MATNVLNKPISETIADVKARVEATNPIDRRSPLARFVFRLSSTGEAKLQPLRADNISQVDLVPANIELSELALDQLLQRLNYPRKLLDRLPVNNCMLDINYLMQSLGDDRMALIRMIEGDTARAILGSRYTPLDDLMLFEVCADFLEGATVRYESFGPLSTHLTVTWAPETEEEYKQGLHRGIHIANSEVGMRSITIGAVVYREVCSNVLPAVGLGPGGGEGTDGKFYNNSQSKGKHDLKGAIQGTVEAGWRFYHQGDPNILRDFVRDAISDSRSQYEGVMARWREGLTQMVSEPIAAIESLADSNDLTSDQLKRVLMGWSEEKAESGPDFANSVTGIVNGFTRAAQGYDDAEERYKIQVAGASGFAYLT